MNESVVQMNDPKGSKCHKVFPGAGDKHVNVHEGSHDTHRM